MLIPALDEKIFSLRDGEVSDPVWTKEGVYILKMLKRTLPVYSPVERSKDQITGLLYEQKREEKYNEWMKKLWERSSVKIVQ
jgi:parvulin-like peptidyl-prolyl isomerase